MALTPNVAKMGIFERILRGFVRHEDILEGQQYPDAMFSFGRIKPINDWFGLGRPSKYFKLQVSRHYGCHHSLLHNRELTGCWLFCVVGWAISHKESKCRLSDTWEFGAGWELHHESEFENRLYEWKRINK